MIVRFRVMIFLLLFAAVGCGKTDQPLDLTPEAPAPSGGNPPAAPLAESACTVNFQANLQIRVSANPPNAGGPFEILDANPLPISEPIPMEVQGSQLTIKADTFPVIYFRPPETAADLRITASPGAAATGTYDSATGEMSFGDFEFSLEIVEKGGTHNFLPGKAGLPPAAITTGPVTATGNLNPISEAGKPLDKSTRNLALALGLTLPTDFAPLTPLNDIMGGGALTARFEGVLDQLPENCTPGGGGGGAPEVEPQPKDLNVSIQNQAFISQVDFGDALVIPHKTHGQTILDCRDATFRGIIGKIVTIKNASTKEKNIFLGQPQDTDGDVRSPLCGGLTEFIRGSVSVAGGATCKTVTVGGRPYPTGECTLPANHPDASVSFPLLYAPFDYSEPPEGEEPPLDTGIFVIKDGENPDFPISLKGRTRPDFRDVFSISKVVNGTVSPKEVHNQGLLKIARNENQPFTQKLVLRNVGTEQWDQVAYSLAKGQNFSVLPSGGTALPAANGTAGLLDFEVVFTPGSGTRFDDTLTVTLHRAGGASAEIKVQLVATVGIPPLRGNVALHFDYITALIDHVALSEPIESNDFRTVPHLAPAPVLLHFSDTAEESIKEFTVNSPTVDLLDPAMTVEDRKKLLRIFTARATVGRDGNRLDPGDTVNDCDEPNNILRPYQGGDCSYFYWTDLKSGTAVYDDDSGQLIVPDVSLLLHNPYHADIFGIWPASNPNAAPDYQLETPLKVTFTTQILNRRDVEVAGRSFSQVPDERIPETQLLVRDKRLGFECPEGFLKDQFPRLKCYLSSDQRYLEGRPVSLREGTTNEFDVILVGVGQFPATATDPDLPWFMGDNGGSRIYIAIQGRLVPIP